MDRTQRDQPGEADLGHDAAADRIGRTTVDSAAGGRKEFGLEWPRLGGPRRSGRPLTDRRSPDRRRTFGVLRARLPPMW
ncbi:hypothetical protein DKT68_18315 [Micromonospora acroterricola]|uniref:Uncharacterized protein n=1 Tax=Micromonospora acroterricola TaxID=2202421 RepID=A0A317D4R6_9ACTN|nr:hypothetical protein DKT68_18315 [Micromonospora acroterricola]